tara:strand:- start:4128 stop:6248 length:2121 start_codon:yes stop_codon:yes gene_type:complete
MASVAPVAKMAGSDLEQTSAILGVLVNNGVEASTAGTALRNIFLDLAKSGKTWDQAMGEINSSTNPLAVSMEMFGKRGANVATILAQSGVEVQSLTQDFKDSTGEAQAMADIMDSGVAGSIRKMRSQLEGAAIELGEKLVPIFKIVINKISSMVKWFTSLSDEQQKSIVKWGLIIAAIGPVLIIIGKLSFGIAALVPAIKFVGVAFAGLYKTMLANPFLAIGALIAGVVLKLTYFSNAAIKARESQEKLNAAIADRSSERLSKNDIFEKVKLWETLTKTQQLNLLEQAKSHKITLENSKLQTNQQGLHNDKIVDLKKQIKSYRDLVKTGSDDPLVSAQIASAPNMIIILRKEIATLQKQMSGGKSVKGFNMDINQMNSLIDDLTTKINGSKDPLTSIDQVVKDLKTTFSGTNTEVEETTEETANLSDETKKLLDQLSEAPPVILETAKAFEDLFPKETETKFKNIEKLIKGLKEELKFLFGDLGELGSRLSDSLNSALGVMDAYNEKMKILAENESKRKTEIIDKDFESQKESIEKSNRSEEEKSKMLEDLNTRTTNAKVILAEETEKKLSKIRKREAIQKKAMGIVDVIVNTASAMSAAFAASPMTLGMPWTAILAGLGAAQVGIIASTPIPFAEGGLVTGPTTALIGEGIGTNAGNPEVVAPLDKLKSMMGGGGNNNIVVTGKLIGNDIYLANQNAGINRKRTV